MPSYPIRPTFPIDVRPSPSITPVREGTGFRFDLNPTAFLDSLAPSRNRFFAALEAFVPGSVATLAAAVPSSPSDPVNRAFNSTAFVTADCTLAVFAKATLALNDEQVVSVLNAARLITE